jgi:phage shock protein A
MALINRISRLFKADFHAVLDRIEEPEQLLRQAVRDMDDQIAESEQQHRVRTHEQQALAKRRTELKTKLDQIDSELDLCFESGKEELVRGLVRKKLEVQRVLQRVEAGESANEEGLADLRRQIDENRNVLESLRQKAEVFSQRSPSRDANVWRPSEPSVSEAEVEVALLRETSIRRVS